MFFKESSPAIMRYSVSGVHEILSIILKAHANQGYAFYLTERLVLRFFKEGNDYIQLTKSSDGEKELTIKHGKLFEYKLYCVYGYSKIYDLNAYRVEVINRRKGEERKSNSEYVLGNSSKGYALFDIV